MLLFAINIRLPAGLAGHGPHLRRQSWQEARCCYELGWLATGILVGGLGERRKVHCFGGLMPVLAGAAPHNHIWTYDLIQIATQSASNKQVEDLMHSTQEKRAQPRSF